MVNITFDDELWAAQGVDLNLKNLVITPENS
jgi:hypothetical protein